jgi:hypothetical protein
LETLVESARMVSEMPYLRSANAVLGESGMVEGLCEVEVEASEVKKR